MRLEIVVSLLGAAPNTELSEGEAAALLGVTRHMLCMARKRGICPRFKIIGARTPVYKAGDVLDFAKKHARVSFRNV